MCHSSPARILRNIKRITKFIERKSIFKPVLSVTILDQINIYPTSQNVLTAAKSISLSCQTIEQIDILPGADCDGSLIRSEFYPYCPECDKTYKREQVMLFREHCRVIHDWLWCKNWYRGDGCEFASTMYEELQEHHKSCEIKPKNSVTIM